MSPAIFRVAIFRGTAMVAGVLALAQISAAADTPTESGTIAPQAALHEGNRLFRDGQIEAAAETYRRGYSPRAPHPTLLYNLGTALHHLDRLPEAILWYRRAAGSDDLWLRDNLLLARRSLGSQTLSPAGFQGWLTRQVDGLRLFAIIVAWLTLLLFATRAKTPPWVIILLALVACGLYGAATAVELWGPRPAVILGDCSSPAGTLPAGTEAWVRPSTDGLWRISGSEMTCPEGTLELVFQRR